MAEPINLLHGDPWMFAPGDLVRHRSGALYTIVTKALAEDALEPVYVYAALSHQPFTTWTRPRAEVEDGRFERVPARALLPAARPGSPEDALDAERDALVDTLEEMVDQHCGDNDGHVDSGCLSANARAIRLLARLGRVTLIQDGPGRAVAGRMGASRG